MSNQTFEERLLKEHTPEPLEGHTVVVFERVGEAGEKFLTLLPPGTPLARARHLIPFFRPAVQYFAYAVDASPELHLSFPEHVVMADHTHRLELLFDLYYAVADAHVLAGARNKDPLRRVRERVAQAIAPEVARLPWKTVRDDFADAGEAVVARALPDLRAFAEGYGLEIHSVRLWPQLTEREHDVLDLDWQADRDIAAIQAQERVDAARRAAEHRRHEQEMKQRLEAEELARGVRTLEANASLQQAFVAGAIGALQRVASGISTADDLISALRAGQLAAAGFTGVETNGSAPDALGAGGASGGVLSATSGRLGSLLAELVAATQKVRVSGQRKTLRAALLHLIAEVVDDPDDRGRPLLHAEHVRAALGRLDPCPAHDEMEALRALADPAHLRAVLED
jgi:hypothetical protein